jgi:thiamine biosynthesis lipoprotein
MRNGYEPCSRLFGWTLATLMGLTSSLCFSQTSNTFELGGKTMGPIDYRVTLVNPPSGLASDQAQQAVQETLDRINRLMSNYRPDSDISRFNASDSTDWFEIELETAVVIQRSLEISQVSEGAFDITVSPAIDRWRFGAAKKDEEFQFPSDEELAELKQRIGYQFLEVRNDPPAVRKSNSRVQINLSGIAKGYAVDAVAKTLRELSCTDFFVEVGGEVFAQGKRVDGTPWRIGIQNPESRNAGVPIIVGLSNKAIATSGDYENFFSYRGKRYSHTIDPKTCRPVENLIASVSVVADDCITADAMATAIMVAGIDKGMELAGSLGMGILVQSRNKDFGEQISLAKLTHFPVLDPGSANIQSAEEPAPASASILPVFLSAAVIILIAVAGMAIGTLFGRRPISGSCGGLANQTNEQGDTVCGVCAKPTSACPELASEPTKTVGS